MRQLPTRFDYSFEENLSQRVQRVFKALSRLAARKPLEQTVSHASRAPANSHK